MSYRAGKSGLAAECQKKIEANFDPAEAAKCLRWIKLLTSAEELSFDLSDDNHDGAKSHDNHDDSESHVNHDGAASHDSHVGDELHDSHDGTELHDSHVGDELHDSHDGTESHDSHVGDELHDSNDGTESHDNHDGTESHGNHDGTESHDNSDDTESHDNHDGVESHDNHDGTESHDGSKSYDKHGGSASHINDAGVPHDTFHKLLRDGVVLCRLIDHLLPGRINWTDKMFQPAKIEAMQVMRERERIATFLRLIVQDYGVSEAYTFPTESLHEEGALNLGQVCVCIRALGIQAQSMPGYNGPAGYWPKKSEKNVREFSEEQLRSGLMIIGLQYGSNKGASQAGMNMGKHRHILE